MSAISLLGVSKFFGDAQALDDVSLDLAPGTVHALVGENGAGKSTALKILAGLERPTSGTLQVDDGPVDLGSRSAAIRRGIGLVPQQLSLIPELDLAENFILSQPERLARRRRAHQRLRAVAADAGLDVPTDVPIRDLGLAQRQLGELAIALAQGARILLLDEPTSALGPYETDALFTRLRTLAASGAAILLITHRVAEVRTIADEVTVLSHGRVTLRSPVAAVTDAELIDAIVGELPPTVPRERAARGATVLTLAGVTASRAGIARLTDVSFDVAAGEIVGVLGVAGNGQGALADAAAGLERLDRGHVRVGETDIAGRPDVAQRAGVAYVPEVRTDFLLPDLPVSHSSILRRLNDPEFVRRGTLRWRAIRTFAEGLLERHDVRPRTVSIDVGSLSGGNQQKLLVGRELDGSPRVAILHGPTQGLDLHAAAMIRAEIRRAADAGTAVLLVSADIDEVRELADRILVMSKGAIADRLAIEDFDLRRIGRAMAGLGAVGEVTADV